MPEAPDAVRRWALAIAACAVVAGSAFAVPRLGIAEDTPIQVIDGDFAAAVRGTTAQVAPTLPPPNTGTGRRAVFSIGQQRVWLFDASETLVRTFLVSARLDMPNVGTYRVFSRSAFTCSIAHPSVCMRYMIRFTKGPGGDNIGFHEIPRDYALPGDPWLQGESQLGQPISDGCLRESTADAQFMWNWAPVGTTVVVIP